jgi:predicted dehydrogenase
MMLQAGKNVLLEKPMTMNYREAQDLATAAKKAKRLLLTNYWTRFFPVIRYVRSVLASNRLGPISAMRGDIGFQTYPDAQDRFLGRSSGGGAMLDVGCYIVNLAIMVNPSVPRDVKASAQTTYMDTEYRVDTETAFLLNWDATAPAEPETTAVNVSWTSPMMLSGQASVRRPSSFEFEINAQHGRVVIHAPANAANAVTVYDYEPFGAVRHIEEVYSELPRFDSSFGPEQYPRGEGFVYVIHEIEQCMLEKGIPGADDEQRNGCLEVEQLSLDDQLLTVRITDMVMRDAGYWDW